MLQIFINALVYLIRNMFAWLSLKCQEQAGGKDRQENYMGKSKWKVDGKRKKTCISKIDISYRIQLQLQSSASCNHKKTPDAGGFINGSLNDR